MAVGFAEDGVSSRPGRASGHAISLALRMALCDAVLVEGGAQRVAQAYGMVSQARRDEWAVTGGLSHAALMGMAADINLVRRVLRCGALFGWKWPSPIGGPTHAAFRGANVIFSFALCSGHYATHGARQLAGGSARHQAHGSCGHT